MKTLFKLLADKNLAPNDLAILCAIRDKSIIPFAIKDVNERMTEMYNQGYIDASSQVTPHGLKLLLDAEMRFVSYKKKKSKSEPVDMGPNALDYIHAYREMFPSGARPGHGHLVRTNVKELFGKFEWFFLNHPEYTWADVLEATQNYIQTQAASGYTHLQVSKYFICKHVQATGDIRSDLATYCEQLSSEPQVSANAPTFYTVR